MIVFSIEWFEKYQKQLLWFANTAWGRYVLRIHGDRSGVGKNKIIKIEPFAITWIEGGKNKIEIRSHAKYSKRMYHAFKWVWWLAHGWDFGIANNLNTALNVGFDTLNFYPGGSGGTVDGIAGRIGSATFSTIRSGAGTFSIVNGEIESVIQLQSSTTSNQWNVFYRSIFVFNTTTIPTNSNIDSANFSLYLVDSYAFAGATDSQKESVLVSVSPSSDTSLASSDYNIAKYGTTALATRYPFASWVDGYNDFALNASGLANINKSTNSRFAIRGGFDLDNSAFAGATDSQKESVLVSVS